jgi:hypothetical protein
VFVNCEFRREPPRAPKTHDPQKQTLTQTLPPPPLNPDQTDCDGGSYAGAREDAIPVGAQTLYYRGSYILDGVYDTLLAQHGLASAATVVVSGCSAGGLAAFIHVDHIAAKIRAANPSARVVGAPGAGFFLGEAAPYAGAGYLSQYKWVFSAHNVSRHINDACVADKNLDAWKCFIAPEVLPYIQTPLFVSNSLSDAWQAGAIMGLGCSPTKAGACSDAQMAYLSNFRAEMLAGLAPVLAAGSKHGGFLQGCFVHVVEDVGGWTSVRINGASQADTFSAWLAGGAGAVQVGTFPPWSNPTC